MNSSHTRLSTPRRLLWLLVIAVALTCPSLAPAAPEPTVPEKGRTDSPAPRAPVDPLNRRTPRDAMAGFLDATGHRDYVRAAQFLDLRRLPAATRAQDGPTLARQLRVVLDQALAPDPETLSDEEDSSRRDGLPPDREPVGTIKDKSGSTTIVLQRVPGDGDARLWKVSSATVAQIPRLYQEYGYGPLGDYLPPVFFEIRFLDLALWQWIGLVLLVAVSSALAWVGAFLLRRAARPLVRRAAPVLGDRFIAAVVGPLRLAIGLMIFAAGSTLLALSIPARAVFGDLDKAVAIFIVTWLMFRASDVMGGLLADQYTWWGRPAASAVVPLGVKAAKIVVAILALIAVLQNVGINVTGVLAGLGIGGLAVALAAQKTVENLFGGITLILDQPVRVGDFCRFGQKLGTVEEFGLRSTRIRTLERTLVSVPNGQFVSFELENFSARDRCWLQTVLGLRYETTPDQLRYVLVELRTMLYAHPMVAANPRIRLVKLGESSLDLEIFAYVPTANYDEFLAVREDIYLRIMDIVAQSGTGLALPSQTTYAAADSGIDEAKRAAAEARVHEWRETGTLYMPDFPAETVSALNSTIRYPPIGSATAKAS
jgi:MscS family membrane protein